MMNNAWEDRARKGQYEPRIEVRLTPEYTRKCLSISLRRTRKRAANLLAELLDALRQQQPDIERMRHLADGIRFESEMARGITGALTDMNGEEDF